MELNNPKNINAWCLFDWANSAYSLIITVAIFPNYYSAVVREAFGESGTIPFFGFHFNSAALYSYAISFSFLLAAILSPILSGIADYGGNKKPFLQFFTVLGSMSCLALFFFTGENIEFGIIMTVLASMGYAGGLVFYNAYLPEIVTPDRYDAVSARGFSMGYFGSVLLLVANLAVILNAESLGLTTLMATKLAFVSVGFWWLGFSQITIFKLPQSKYANKSKTEKNKFLAGFEEIQKVWRQLQSQVNIKRFLASFFLYNAGVQTVIYMASMFGEQELKLEMPQLITTILILQILAILGAWLFSKISTWRGNKFSIFIMLVIWTIICLVAYFVKTPFHFYSVAGLVGLVMGGIQSLSRATYSKLLPKNTPDTTSYFSFYDVLEKSSTVIGTFVYGLLAQLTNGNLRVSSLALAGFFILGMFVFQSVKIQKPHPTEA